MKAYKFLKQYPDSPSGLIEGIIITQVEARLNYFHKGNPNYYILYYKDNMLMLASLSIRADLSHDRFKGYFELIEDNSEDIIIHNTKLLEETYGEK